ncbi:MAG: ribosome biogenesis GTPase Der [Bacteroidetes bacterium]|nr:ribosome biogenesis GTPase Der [Bacteroidota bacterium]
MSKIAAIVGRPNVGKSTLFNRLVGARKAIVDDLSGVTRDRHYGKAEWKNREFVVIDTGGYVPHSSDVFESAIRDQVVIAIEESDILIFMVDVTTGITDLDMAFADLLRKSRKPVMLVVNKVDNNDKLIDAAEFYSLGFDPLFNLSSMTGSGTGEMLDYMYDHLELEKEEELIPTGDLEEVDEDRIFPDTPGLPKVAIVGRPNVGKSSLVNAFLGYDRNIVTPIAGTTRDTIHTHYNAFGKEMLLVDTAGIRKKGKVHENIEFYSVLRAIRAIEECDVCVIMVDATLGVQAQDLNLFHLAMKNSKGILLLVNKWDLIENKETNTVKQFEESIRSKTAPFVDYPIHFISVQNKQRIFKAIESIESVYENMKRTVSTSKLNEFILPIIEQTPPPSQKGKYIRIKYATQLKANSVVFAFFCNLPQYVKDSYKRFLENKIRNEYNFQGVPIKLFFRKK